MPSYKYPASTLSEHGCRIVPDDASYVDNAGERSVFSSPLVDIPKGHLLVGPTKNRLMLLHAMLMSSDMEINGVPEDGAPIGDQDVIDLATGLMENFGYEALVAPMGRRFTLATPEQDVALNAVRATRGPIWSAVAGIAISHGDRFKDAAEADKVFLVRKPTPGVGILDQGATQPMMWESQIVPGPRPVLGWRVPGAAVSRMIDAAMELPEIVALPEAKLDPAYHAGITGRQVFSQWIDPATEFPDAAAGEGGIPRQRG